MQTKTVAVVLALTVSLATVGALSYTTATVDRSATITLEQDTAAVIGLSAGPVAGISDGPDRLVINLGTGNGLNTESNFTFGDSTAATTTFAFSVTNNDGASHTFDFSYGFSGTPPAASGVTFEVFDNTGTSVGTFDDATSLTGVTIPDTTTYYVVITVDSTGTAATDDLSGTLTISAN